MEGSSLAKASVIRASSDSRAEDNTTGHYSFVDIGSHGQINVAEGKYGAIVSRYTNMYGGTINVDGTLVVAGSLAFSGDAEVNVRNDISNATEWGNFNLSGGNINIGETGLIYMAAEDLVLSYSGGALKGTLALLDNDTEFSAAAAAKLGKGALYVSEVDVEYGSTLTVDALDLSGLSGGKGQIEVFDDASLVVTDKTTFGGVDTLILNDNSSLTANFADFLTNAYTLASDAVADALKIAATTANSIIYLRGNSGTYDQGDLDAVTALLDDSGNDKLTVAFLGGLMEGIDDLGGDGDNASIEKQFHRSFLDGSAVAGISDVLTQAIFGSADQLRREWGQFFSVLLRSERA